jgi:L-asparagine transporter-like permease
MAGTDGNSLDKTLSLKDLVLFGVISIFGSGGFNLIGHALVQGGDYWPLALAAAAALFLGSSRTYEQAFNEFKKNTSESDFLEKMFGKSASYLTIVSILVFSVFSMATILVLCVRLLIPDAAWLMQSFSAVALVGVMGLFSLQGIHANKDLVNISSGVLVFILSCVSLVGLGGVFQKGVSTVPTVPEIPNPSLTQSFLYYFYLIAGFDVLMKFSEETKDPTDVPKSFYISNIIGIVFILGLSLAVVNFTDLKKVKPLERAVGFMLNNLTGMNIRHYFSVIAVFFMIITMFVTFLATTRYIFSLGEKYEGLRFMTELNENKVPTMPIIATTAVVGATVLINHFGTLVSIADLALGSFLFLVAAAATKFKYDKGEIPIIEGLTATGFIGVFTATAVSHMPFIF